MKLKRNPAEEIMLDGDRSVRFVSSFGFAQALESLGRDVQAIAIDLINGQYNAEEVRNVLICSLTDVDGEALTDKGKQEYAEHLIEQYGLTECSIIARYVCVAIQVGEAKKRQLALEDNTRKVMASLIPSRSRAIWKVGLLWVVMVASSTALACLITKLFILPSV